MKYVIYNVILRLKLIAKYEIDVFTYHLLKQLRQTYFVRERCCRWLRMKIFQRVGYWTRLWEKQPRYPLGWCYGTCCNWQNISLNQTLCPQNWKFERLRRSKPIHNTIISWESYHNFTFTYVEYTKLRL